jgi:folylpolyglutamate synthase/dihydropteroate synthase
VEKLRRLAVRFVSSDKVIVSASVAEAIDRARDQTAPGGIICVTGSLYLLGEAIAILKASKVH